MPQPPSFAQHCGIHDEGREAHLQALLRRLDAERIGRVRVAWCDAHGMLRSKTLLHAAVEDALRDGVGMVGTLMLKDTSDRTAWKVFEPGALDALPGFANAANLVLLPDPASLHVLPWAEGTAWLRAQPWFPDGRRVPLDTRRVLQQALKQLAKAGYGLRCGLEVEFHIYRLVEPTAPALATPDDPQRAAWPGEPPEVALIHPGYNLLSDGWSDRADAPLRIVQQTAEGLGLPLRSLEIELGPSQVEAVFDATDALQAADQMVLFRNGVTQALRRAGYHASFMCRPPFPAIMSSGWHLHQSLIDLRMDRNAFVPAEDEAAAHAATDARRHLSAAGVHYLGGLLAHGPGMAPFCTPTVNGYARYQPNVMAPQAVVWGQENRGAMLRLVGAGTPAVRIENRIGEPAANPYLYIAAQIHAGLDGIRRALAPPPACESPYAADLPLLPTGLAAALEALEADAELRAGFGEEFTRYYATLLRAALMRHAQAADPAVWERREYFSRF